MSKLSYITKRLNQLKFETQLKFYSSILGVISQSFSWNCPVSFDVLNFPGVIFTIEMIGNETGPLLNFVYLSSKAINKSET